MSETPSACLFKLNISGQIEYIELPDAGNQIHCHAEFVVGPDWKIIGGLEAALSQTMITGPTAKYIANLPLEVLFQSTNPFGWPQIVISCYNGDKCMGIGRGHVPVKLSGDQTVKISLARPTSSIPIANILGKRPGLRDSKMLTDTNALPLIRMESCGMASLSLNLTAHGLRGLGYDIG